MLFRTGQAVVAATYVYALVLAILVILEDRLLFHPVSAASAWKEPPPQLSVGDVNLKLADGTGIHAWWSAPADWQPETGVVLFSHGRGGNLSTCVHAISEWRAHSDLAVLIFDYPGFGKSDGTPTEVSCYAAADVVYNYAVTRQKVPPQRVILYGESFGGAIATELAVHHGYRALILASTFTSFPDMAQSQFPIMPGRWLVHNRFDTLAKLGGLAGPVLIAHGTADGLVPFGQGERLFRAAHGPKEFFAIKNGRHGLPHAVVIEESVRFLAKVGLSAAKTTGPSSGCYDEDSSLVEYELPKQ
jgi:pimeloyl-ACP methyl ester carboxylesterase